MLPERFDLSPPCLTDQGFDVRQQPFPEAFGLEQNFGVVDIVGGFASHVEELLENIGGEDSQQSGCVPFETKLWMVPLTSTSSSLGRRLRAAAR